MRKKKSLGEFLSKKKSWKNILQYLEKYLNKYGSWKQVYEFDRGSVHIAIILTDHSKPLKTEDMAPESHPGRQKGKQRHKRR